MTVIRRATRKLVLFLGGLAWICHHPVAAAPGRHTTTSSTTNAVLSDIACKAGMISVGEAKSLAILAAGQNVAKRFHLDAESSSDGPVGTYTFRVFTTNRDPGTTSNLAGWFSVNQKTAVLTDPVRDDRPITILAVRRMQERLRREHCLAE